jgi:tRNA modification GTPase
LAGIDHGIAGRLNEQTAQLTPHGGPRVIQRLTARLRELGATTAPALGDVDPLHLYPEAADRIEALTLLAMARAESPMAIDPLLAQPPRWRDTLRQGRTPGAADIARSTILNRLIRPPMVVLAGASNVGKSTLSNALLGRSMSIAADVPGTTRDYVAGRLELAGLVVDWHDTPGLRADADAIERQAIDLARRLMQRADLLIAMRDHEHDWPELPRRADLYVINKADQRASAMPMPGSGTARDPLHTSARTGAGLAELTSAVRELLVPAAVLRGPGLWIFDERLLAPGSSLSARE